MDTYLVLTGITKRVEVPNFPYQPTLIFESIAEIATTLAARD
jgi:ribonucleotide monophosphatase NagD (HAD superfamily)